MYIRQVKKQRNSEAKIFYQYTLVQASRVNGKSRQTILLYLGSDSLLEDKTNRKIVTSLLKKKIFPPNALQAQCIEQEVNPVLENLAQKYYKKYRIKHHLDDPETTHKQPSIPSSKELSDYDLVDLDSLQTDQVKTYGAEYLCTHTLRYLGIDSFIDHLGWTQADQHMALLAIASRAIFTASEHMTSQYLKDNSALLQCVGQVHRSVSHKQLYRISDKLYSEKNKIDKYLYNKICTLFNLKDKLVIFDLSNTYFESRKDNSQLARYGRSKEKRSDCKVVVFSGVINAEGFIRHSRIYEGNKPDSKTIEDLLDDLKEHSSGQVQQTVVIDAGIATQDNLQMIESKGYTYTCVSRTRPDDYSEQDLQDTTSVFTSRGRQQVELKILKKQKNNTDTWMYVKSEAKQAKEQSMEDKLGRLFVEKLEQIKLSLSKKRGIKTVEKVWERIGRAKEKYASAAKDYLIEVIQKATPTSDNTTSKKSVKPIVREISWTKIERKTNHGIYYIRTNEQVTSETQVWNTYNTIREVESTFRCLKSQLHIRPVHHQLDHRIQGHIYLTILAYQLVNTIRHQLKSQGLTHDWSQILRIMNTHTIQRTSVKTTTQTISISKPAKPIQEAQAIYKTCGCSDHQKSFNKDVVYH